MAYNTQTITPKRGDIAIKNSLTALPKYISYETYDATDFATRWSGYEIIGNAVDRRGDEVLVVRNDKESKLYCNRAWWYLTGYTLDGTERTGVLSIRAASNEWASNISKTITYTASTMADLVSALNTAFAADTDFSAQDWYADIQGSGANAKIRLHCNNIAWQQCSYNTASSGFTLSGSLPEIFYSTAMRRKNGVNSGEGCISNWARAIAYFTNDNSSTTYNPASDVTSVKVTYPICLPGYLGTSQYQSDHCAALRAVYGEGQTGWLKFMKSFLPVRPTDYGMMGIKSGKEMTALLVANTYTSSAVSTESACCAAADFCYKKPASLNYVADGEFWLPCPEEVARILDGVQYGTSSSRSADALNAGILAAGGTAISNGSDWWSSSRCDTGSAWYARGYVGFFHSLSMCGSVLCCPVSLYKVS